MPARIQTTLGPRRRRSRKRDWEGQHILWCGHVRSRTVGVLRPATSLAFRPPAVCGELIAMDYRIAAALLACVCVSACAGGDDDAGETSFQMCLAEGDYEVEYVAVADDCGLGDLPTELLTIRANGSVAGSVDTPPGCKDSEVTDVECVRDLTRRCTNEGPNGTTLQTKVDTVIDANKLTGSVSIISRVYNGDVLQRACSSTYRVSVIEA